MSRRCDLTGVDAQFGNNVSHPQRKTRRSFDANIRVVHYQSVVTGQKYKFKVAAKTMRTIEKVGGFDAYMQKASSASMSVKARSVRKLIIKKSAASTAA